MTKNEIIKAICQYAQSMTEIAAVYLFGSYANDNYDVSSDIDLAVLLHPAKIIHFDKLAVMADLSALLHKDTDVIILNCAPPLLSGEIRKKGLLIYDSSPPYRKKFILQQRKIYQDYIYIHKHFIKGIKKRYGR